MKWGVVLISLTLWIAIPAWSQDVQYREGEHYKVIRIPLDNTTSESGKVVVTELFSYACIHCYNFEPLLEEWLEKQGSRVEFKRVHVVFSSQSLSLAKAFYTAEELGVLDSIHEPMFSAIHVNRLKMHQVPLLERIFESRGGVPKEKFNEVFSGFKVENQIRQGDSMVRAWRIEGTPAMVVAGRYVAGGTSVRNNAQLLDVVDFLVSKIARETL